MSDLAEVKGLFSDTQKTIEALRGDFEDLKGKSADFVDTDRQEKMKAELAGLLEKEQKAMAERVEKLETSANRPGGAEGKKDDEYAKKFSAFLRDGESQSELKAEMKAMGTNVASDGGLMVSDGMRAGIQARNWRTSPIEALATSVTFSGANYEILVERDEPGSGWGASESAVITETTTPTINKISIATHDLRAMPKVPQRLLDVSDYDVEGFLVGQVNNKFARDKASAFAAGSGLDRPKGVLAYNTATTDDDTRAVETIQHRETGVNGDFAASNPGDVLIRTFYDLQGAYQGNASWMMKNTTAAEVATFKDDSGYLLRAILNSDGAIVRTIQGRPVYVADDVPVYTGTGALGIILGDFSNYTIVNSPTVSLVRDIYTQTPNVLFKFFTRVGGGVTDFDAFKLIKFTA